MADFSLLLGLPIILTVFGILMGIAGRPKKINWWFGYRTNRASANQETWDFTHRYFGKLSLLSGLTTLTFSIGALIYREHEFIWVWALSAQGVSFIMSIILTEIALRKEFDKDGNRKQ